MLTTARAPIYADTGFNTGHTTGVPNTPTWNQANYTTWMKYIYTMQNLTFGADGGLTEACETKHPDEPGLCFMSPHMQDTIKTPFFMFNSTLHP